MTDAETEDLTFLPSVQNSAESPAFRSIVVNYQARRIYHAHEHIDRVIGPAFCGAAKPRLTLAKDIHD